MEILKNNYISLSISIFVMAIVMAHLFSSGHYDWTKNTISDLGAQGYSRKVIMQFGFLAFGLILTTGILMNGVSWRTAPILMYGLCVGLSGIFCTKPFVDGVSYSANQSFFHSIFAQVAGVSFTIGILIQIFFTTDNQEKYIHLLFFALVIGLSISFGLLKNNQGIAQRLLYIVSFIWLIKYFKI